MGLFATQFVSVILSSNVWGSSWVCDWQAQVCLCLLFFVNSSSTGTSSLCHPVTEEGCGGLLPMFCMKDTQCCIWYLCSNTTAQSPGHCLEIRGGANSSFLWSGSQVTMEKGKSATLFTPPPAPPSSVEWQLELHGPILMGLFEVSRSSVVSRAFCLRQDSTTDWTLCVAAFPHKDSFGGGPSNRTLLSINTHHNELYQSKRKPLYLFACGQKPRAQGCLSAAWSALSLSELEVVPQGYTWKLWKLMMLAQFHRGPIPEAVPCCGYSPWFTPSSETGNRRPLSLCPAVVTLAGSIWWCCMLRLQYRGRRWGGRMLTFLFIPLRQHLSGRPHPL